MNERIKELVKLAWQQRDLVTPTRAMDDAFTDKFAELIVRECAKIAVFKDSGTVATADVAGHMAAGRSMAAKLIKEHFGVEE